MRNILEQIKNELGYSNAEDAEYFDAEDAEDMEMLEMADYYDSLDAEDFAEMLDDAEESAEYEEFLEMVEDADRRKRFGRGTGHRKIFKGGLHRKPTGRKHHLPVRKKAGSRVGLAAGAGAGAGFAGGRMTRKPAAGSHKQAVNQALRNTGGSGNFNNLPSTDQNAFIANLMAHSKGDLNITVIRQTGSIVQPLPYILFGLNGFNSSFISTMKNYLPAGVTMVASADPATGDMLLTYTDGVNTDIIRVTLTGSQISYMEFLENMNSNFFKTQYIRQEYPNDKNILLSVSQTINFGLLSALGAKSANNLLPRSRRQTADYQTFIVNLFLDEQKITSDFSFVQKIIPTADYAIAWDVVMSQRVNLNNV